MNDIKQNIITKNIERAVEILINSGCSFHVQNLKEGMNVNMEHGEIHYVGPDCSRKHKRRIKNRGVTNYLRTYISADTPHGEVLSIPYSEFEPSSLCATANYVCKSEWQCERESFELVRDDESRTLFISR